MWAPLALAAALGFAPAQADTLEVKGARFTNGLFGQERADSKFLPGDVVFLMFDVEGLKVDKNGRVLYSVATELTLKGKAKAIHKRDPEDLQALLHLGGSRLPSWHRSVLNPDTQPGSYTLKITLTDRVAKKTVLLTRTFEVVPKKFGFVRVGLSAASGDPTPPIAVPGQLIGVNFAITGYALNKKGQPDVTIELRVLDSAGQPTLRRPYTGELKSIGATPPAIVPFDAIPLPINQSGRFKIELKAIDNVAKKTVEQVLDLNVIEPKK